MKLLRESMTKVVSDRFVVRVWRQEALKVVVSRSVLQLRISDIIRRSHTPAEIAREVIKLKNINAVEVLDAAGNGELLYRNWP